MSNGQTGSAATGNAGVYGAATTAQQSGYGTGQDAFTQSSSYPSQTPFGAFGQQPTGYGGTQVHIPNSCTATPVHTPALYCSAHLLCRLQHACYVHVVCLNCSDRHGLGQTSPKSSLKPAAGHKMSLLCG